MKRLPRGVYKARCCGCKRPILVVQPTLATQLGIKPDLKAQRCEECTR